jgi:hypothetical protein
MRDARAALNQRKPVEGMTSKVRRLMFREKEGELVVLELTHKVDGKRIIINMELVRIVYPMAEGSDLIFDPHHTASVAESPVEISQLLANASKRTPARKGKS